MSTQQSHHLNIKMYICHFDSIQCENTCILSLKFDGYWRLNDIFNSVRILQQRIFLVSRVALSEYIHGCVYLPIKFENKAEANCVSNSITEFKERNNTIYQYLHIFYPFHSFLLFYYMSVFKYQNVVRTCRQISPTAWLYWYA